MHICVHPTLDFQVSKWYALDCVGCVWSSKPLLCILALCLPDFCICNHFSFIDKRVTPELHRIGEQAGM